MDARPKVSTEQKSTEVLRAGPSQRFKPYTEYKDPGVEWFGKIPALSLPETRNL